MSERVDFSANASIYDRRHGAALADDDLDRLWMVFPTEGFDVVVIAPGPTVTLQEFLRRLVEGQLSYVWRVPADARAECLPRLRRWGPDSG